MLLGGCAWHCLFISAGRWVLHKKRKGMVSHPFRDPYRIQTCNLLIRSQTLYSVELMGQFVLLLRVQSYAKFFNWQNFLPQFCIIVPKPTHKPTHKEQWRKDNAGAITSSFFADRRADKADKIQGQRIQGQRKNPLNPWVWPVWRHCHPPTEKLRWPNRTPKR